MSNILSFVSPLEFLLRYTVILGIVLAVIGVAMVFLAKRITMARRGTDNVSKGDRLYQALLLIGLAFILIGMIVIALPVDATFYKG